MSSPALYSQALKELASTYGHPSLISRTYFQSLIQLPRVNQNDYKALLKFSQTVNGAVASLKSGGYSHELQSSSLLDTITSKLPSEVQSRWGRQIVKKQPVCLNLQDFAAWLSIFVKGEMMAKHCQFNVAPVPSVKPKPGSKPGRQTDQRTSSKPTINAIAQPVSSSTPVQSKPKSAQLPGGSVKKLICLLCKGDHRLGQCESFIGKSLDQRMVVIKDNGCCLRCLSRGHMSKECTSRNKCGTNNCGQPHHPLLHDAPSISNTPASDSKSILKKTEKSVTLPLNVATVSADDDDSYTVLQIVPITIESHGKTLETYGFLDQGSQKTLILDRAAQRLNLCGAEGTTTLGTFHGEDPVINITKVKSIFNLETGLGPSQ